MPEITLHDAPDDAGNPVRYTFLLPGGWDDPKLEARHVIAISKALCVSAAMERELLAAQGHGNDMDVATMDDEQKAAQDEARATARGFAKVELLRELLDLPAALASRLPTDPEAWMYETDLTDYRTGFAPVEEYGYTVMPQLDWCWQPPKLERSLLPVIEHGGTTWRGPDDDFTSMVLDQWLFCMQLLKNFKEAKPEDSEQQLNYFMGALYVPAHVKKWRHEPIDDRALRLADLSPYVKLAAVMGFEAIQATMPDKYNRVWDPMGSAAQSPMGVFGIAYDVARSNVFGPERDVRQELLHNVLGYMEHNLFCDEEAERKAKEAETNTRQIYP